MLSQQESAQKVLDGKEPAVVPFEQKVCPFIAGQCMKGKCYIYLPKQGYCGIQQSVVVGLSIQQTLEQILRELERKP